MDASAPLDGPVVTVYQGDAVVLPLTYWQTPPTYGTDGRTVVTPGVPVDMTGMALPTAAFLLSCQPLDRPLAVTDYQPKAGKFTVTMPGRGQSGDLTSGLPVAPASADGPRVRVRYTDAAGNPKTFGTFYLAVER